MKNEEKKVLFPMTPSTLLCLHQGLKYRNHETKVELEKTYLKKKIKYFKNTDINIAIE